MSLSYSLRVSTTWTPEIVLRRLYSFIGLEPDIESIQPSSERKVRITAFAGNLHAIAFEIDPQKMLRIYQLNLNICVLFPITSTGYEDSTILRAVATWLKNTQGDTIFQFEDLPLLIRKAGKLNVNSDIDIWELQYLALLPEPYEMVPMKP